MASSATTLMVYGLLLALSILGRTSEPAFFESAPRLTSLVPRESAASVEGSLATVLNPAALGAREDADFTYLRTLQGDFSKDDSFFLSWAGAGLGLEYAHAFVNGKRIPFRKTTLSGGSHLGQGIYFGTAHSWFASGDNDDYDRLGTWDVGLLSRQEYLALGIIARNVNRPKFMEGRLEREFHFSAATRPGTDRLTLSFDFLKPDTESFRAAWKRGRYFAGVEIEPLRGFQFAGNVYGDKQFEARATVSFEVIRFGAHQRVLNSERTESVGIFNLHRGMAKNALYRPRYAVVVTPDEWKKAYWTIRRDPRVVGVIVKLDGERMALAEWQEFRNQLKELKHRGLAIGCYIHETGTGGYSLASVADTVALDPIGEIQLVGLRSETLFYTGAMEKFGVTAAFERAGNYKSGIEPFTRENDSSQPVLENTNLLLDGLYGEIVTAIADGRQRARDDVKALIDKGPYLGEAAKNAGLVDIIATPDDAEKLFEKQFRGASVVVISDYEYGQYRPTDWKRPPDKLAIVRVEGTMIDGKSFHDPLTGTRMTGSETIVDAIEGAAADSAVKAIILDIDSGGGLVSASERIWRSLIEAKKEKPIVARIGGIGASGAYYIAAAANTIVAEPSSVTGSIGVYTGRISLEGTLAKVGVGHESLLRGANADFFSRYTDATPRHREILKEQVDSLYDLFLERVSAGRNMTKEAVHAVAQGQVWTGKDAKARNLVDTLGGMSEAILAAKTLAHIPPNRLMEVEMLPKPTLIEQLSGFGLVGLARRTPNDPATTLAADAVRSWEMLTRHRIFLWQTLRISDGS